MKLLSRVLEDNLPFDELRNSQFQALLCLHKKTRITVFQIVKIVYDNEISFYFAYPYCTSLKNEINGGGTSSPQNSIIV